MSAFSDLFGPQGPLASALASAHARQADATPEEPAVPPVLIKRYANRRLYDTGRSAYITLDDLAGDLASGRRVHIVDAKTGDDLTQRTMVQVLLTDQHAHKLDFLPEEFLRTLIQLEDQSLMRLFAHYLKMTLSSFAVAQNAVAQNLELMRTMAPGPTQLLGALANFLGGAAPPTPPPPRGAPEPEPEE
ncbi:MAG: hypothetical protein KC583_18690 [Myxococcales bacterium]|nr:hypothetical protein [Myxococcales bacterium]